MSNDPMLSQEEVDSLLSGVSGDSDTTASPAATSPEAARIQPFDPASQQRVVRGRLQMLDIINERFARHFRTSLFNLIRRSADVTASAVKIKKYSDFTRYLPVPSNINLVSMKPLRGNALVVFPPNMVFLVVDSLFGGDGRLLTKSDGRDFTPTEQRIIRWLLNLALESYGEAWTSVYPLELGFQRAEMQIKFADITASVNELVVDTTFHVEIGSFNADFHICIPYATIEPIRELLSSPLQKRDPEEQRQRAARLASEVKQSHVQLAADLAHIPSTLGQIRRLKVGDILPLALPEEITARVDDVPVFRCVFGRLNNRKALRVTRMIDHRPATTGLDPSTQDSQP